MRWLQLVVLVLGMGGSYLMLYGNAQDGGEQATITGTVVVIVVGLLVVVSAVTGERRSRRQHTALRSRPEM